MSCSSAVRRATPNPPACEMSIVEIGVTAPPTATICGHTPRRSKIRRAPCDSASDRSPRIVSPDARASSATMSRSGFRERERERTADRARADDDYIMHLSRSG